MRPNKEEQRDVRDDLLSDEEFDQALYEFTLGSFPHLWDVARKKICNDRKARTALMREVSDGSLRASAEAPDIDVEGLVALLRRAEACVADKALQTEITNALLLWEE